MTRPKKRHKFVCGEAALGDVPDDVHRLIADEGPHRNLKISIAGIGEQLGARIPPRFGDLIMLAAYVLTADQVVERGDLDDEKDDLWHRHLSLQIPVVDLAFWRDSAIVRLLRRTLDFLTGDTWDFEFLQGNGASYLPRQTQITGDGGLSLIPAESVGQIMLFSGGLDSFSGAWEQVVVHGSRTVLVSHDSATKIQPKQQYLADALRKRNPSASPIHVGVTFEHLNGLKADERTQRSRSFLYAALGATVAYLLGKNEFYFYENGFVSFNLPVGPEVVGARASRTTHPQVLAWFSELMTEVAAPRVFTARNPFLFLTRAQVMKQLIAQGGGEYIQQTVSCAHYAQKGSTMHPQCGMCSQCIDRRFAAAANHAEDLDPVDLYKIDFLVEMREHRRRGHPWWPSEQLRRSYALEYVEMARKFASCEDFEALASMFGESSRGLIGTVAAMGGDSRTYEREIHGLHQRHGRAVEYVVGEWLKAQWPAVADGKRDESLLAAIVGRGNAAAQQAARTEAKALYRFEKVGEVWWMAFPGHDSITMPNTQKGYPYIAYLLRHPGESIGMWDLLKACGETVQEAPEPTVIDRRRTPEATEQLLSEMESLRSQLAEAEEMCDVESVEELQGKVDKLQRYLDETAGKGGKATSDAPERSAMRKRIGMAISRAISEIKTQHKPLGVHLQAETAMGFVLRYTGVVRDWTLS